MPQRAVEAAIPKFVAAARLREAGLDDKRIAAICGIPLSDLQQTVSQMDVLRGLWEIGCTDEEQAAVIECSIRTLQRSRARDPWYAAQERRYKAARNIRLRRRQLDMALDGDRTMLVWLGKQFLGQSESSRMDVKGKLEQTTYVIEAPSMAKDGKSWAKHYGANGADPDTDGPERVH